MNDHTLLLRQVHPSFLQGDKASSQAFRPTPKDKQRLSVYDGDMIAAEPAYHHYTVKLGHASAGVMGLLVAECIAEGLTAVSDPEPFQEHALIDFSSLSKNATERAAKRLRAASEMRGWLYRASV